MIADYFTVVDFGIVFLSIRLAHDDLVSGLSLDFSDAIPLYGWSG